MTFAMAESSHMTVDYGVAARPLRGELESGDLHVVIPRPRGAIVAVADGLGHGYEAALAAKMAVNTLTAQAHFPLPDLVKACHEALLRTRGVAMSIASLESETMTWLAVGNVAALLLHADESGKVAREHILMRNGVVGHRLPLLRAATQRIHRGDLLIFATDGVREGFESAVRHDARPQETADRILAQFGKITDDALVLVGRWNGPPQTVASP